MAAKRSTRSPVHQDDAPPTAVDQAAPPAPDHDALEGVVILKRPDRTDPVPTARPDDRDAEPVPAVPANDGPPEPPDPLGADDQQLLDQFTRQYRATCELDLQAMYVEKRRAFAYFELGRLAVQVKATLAHGEWLPWLETHGFNARYVQRAMQIFQSFEDHDEDLANLTVTEAIKYGDKLAAVDADEQKSLDAVEGTVTKKYGERADKAKKDETGKIRAAFAAKRRELRQKVLAVLATNGDLEKELQTLLAPQGPEQAPPDGDRLDTEAPPVEEQLLTEATEGALKLRDLAAALYDTDSTASAAEILCRYLYEVLLPDFEVQPDEHAAFELFADACQGEQRALLVALALTRDLFNPLINLKPATQGDSDGDQ